MLSNKQKNIILIVLSIILFPISILFLCSSNKSLLIEDVRVTNERLGMPWRGVLGLIYLMIEVKYFRNIFYMRINKKPFLIRLFFPEDSNFRICKRNIGPGMYAAHPFSTILNAKSIGKNFSFRQCTTLGNKEDGRNDLVPVIGDNVTLGSHVCIIGDITIGNNVIVGAGSVVVKSVPDNVVVVGNPARVIRKNNEHSKSED